MVRTRLIPANTDIHLTIPVSYVGKEVEVMLYIKDEGLQNAKDEKKTSFTVLHVDNKNYRFNRDEANER